MSKTALVLQRRIQNHETGKSSGDLQKINLNYK